MENIAHIYLRLLYHQVPVSSTASKFYIRRYVSNYPIIYPSLLSRYVYIYIYRHANPYYNNASNLKEQFPYLVRNFKP